MLVLSEHTATGSAHVSSSDRAAEVVRDLCGVRAREISCRLPPPTRRRASTTTMKSKTNRGLKGSFWSLAARSRASEPWLAEPRMALLQDEARRAIKDEARRAIARCRAQEDERAARSNSRQFGAVTFAHAVLEMSRVDDEALAEQTRVDKAHGGNLRVRPRVVDESATAPAERFLYHNTHVEDESARADALAAAAAPADDENEGPIASGPMAEIQRMKKKMNDETTPNPHAIGLAVGREFCKLRDWASAIENLAHAARTADIRKQMLLAVSKREREAQKLKIERMDAASRAKYLELQAQRGSEQYVREVEKQRVRIAEAHRE